VSPPFALATTDADHVETLRANLVRADYCWSDAEHVPRAELDDVVIELGATGPDDDVGLLPLPMPVLAER
jgi:hypothetical protein